MLEADRGKAVDDDAIGEIYKVEIEAVLIISTLLSRHSMTTREPKEIARRTPTAAAAYFMNFRVQRALRTSTTSARPGLGKNA